MKSFLLATVAAVGFLSAVNADPGDAARDRDQSEHQSEERDRSEKSYDEVRDDFRREHPALDSMWDNQLNGLN